MLLKERQIDLITSTTMETRGYTDKITVRVIGGEQQQSSAAGTVFQKEEIRLVRLNNYRLEAELEGINLLIQNMDKPGTIGYIGQTLGEHQVNIANMHLSRTPERDKAIAIVRLDAEAPAAVLETLRSHPNILSVQQVRL